MHLHQEEIDSFVQRAVVLPFLSFQSFFAEECIDINRTSTRQLSRSVSEFTCQFSTCRLHAYLSTFVGLKGPRSECSLSRRTLSREHMSALNLLEYLSLHCPAHSHPPKKLTVTVLYSTIFCAVGVSLSTRSSSW